MTSLYTGAHSHTLHAEALPADVYVTMSACFSPCVWAAEMICCGLVVNHPRSYCGCPFRFGLFCDSR